MKFLACVVVLCVALQVQCRNSPQQLVEIGGQEYFISGANDMHPWNAAQAKCNGLSMTLVNFETPDENTAVKNYLSSNGLGGIGYWTGGKRVGGVWMWSTLNEPYTYSDWNVFAGEPDYDGPGDACMYLGPSTGWLDESCDELSFHYICE